MILIGLGLWVMAALGSGDDIALRNGQFTQWPEGLLDSAGARR